MNPEGLLYSKDHEWIGITGDTGTVGITLHAQKHSVMWCTSNFPGRRQIRGPQIVWQRRVRQSRVGTIHALVREVIESIRHQRQTETLNSDPYGKGWLIRIRIAIPQRLLPCCLHRHTTITLPPKRS
jgi:glycine cleavage system H protein